MLVTEYFNASYGAPAPGHLFKELKGLSIQPLSEWAQISEGTYKLTHGVLSIGLPSSTDFGPVANPFCASPFTIRHLDHHWSTIELEGSLLPAMEPGFRLCF